ncbi:PIR Superfamily Protein [Plasmodium ovale wallikeri]|uniref:PIR Superfamily Protein n=1 Tax=Plasmodium ovale wallikeri TaxID=864142 RepID=A0A1A8ZKS9_PLAOA|nr:PIR Superfamily Protein [Plasmodium ovale wallikeri]SBT44434.1 PIR Superfamily Protein [Plasmodium ovale wallikeri]
MSSAIPDMYSFFEKYKTYKLYESEMEKKYTEDKGKTTCDAFVSDVKISSTETARNLCIKFKIFYKFIISINQSSKLKFNSLYNNDFAYLNYWLNGKLRNTKINHRITVESFYESMSVHDDDFAGNSLFDNKLFHIEENDFNNMILLSHLDDQYSEIYQNVITRKGEKISCLEYYKEFADKYNEGIRSCSDNNNFCNTLNIYKKKYEGFSDKTTISEKCIDEHIPKLLTYDDVSLGDKKITVVSSILGPSFATVFTSFFLYMFTPLGQWIRAKMGTKRGALSNLYEESDQLSLNTLDDENVSFGENPYLISYDSVVNS